MSEREIQVVVSLPEGDSLAGRLWCRTVRGRESFYFGLSLTDARERAVRIGAATSSWRHVAAASGLTPRQIDRMSSAFEHEDSRLATTL